jgi:hypothetical protein
MMNCAVHFGRLNQSAWFSNKRVQWKIRELDDRFLKTLERLDPIKAAYEVVDEEN